MYLRESRSPFLTDEVEKACIFFLFLRSIKYFTLSRFLHEKSLSVVTAQCNEYFSLKSCNVFPTKAVKRGSTKSYCPQKKKSLSFMFDLPYEICPRTAFHIIPYCSWPTAGLLTAVNYKMADRSRGAIKKKEEKGKERMAKTHFGNLASPPLLLQLPMGSNKREDLDVNHFLQVVNSQGRQNESDVCVFISSGGIAATLCQKAWLLFSHTLPQTLENVGL